MFTAAYLDPCYVIRMSPFLTFAAVGNVDAVPSEQRFDLSLKVLKSDLRITHARAVIEVGCTAKKSHTRNNLSQLATGT